MQELIFWGFWFLTTSKTKLKQEQKQSKENGTERLPFPVASRIPGNGARKIAWWLRVGEPQEEGYDVDSSKFSLEFLPKVIEPVGLGDLRKVVGDDSSPGASKIASS